MSRTLIGCLVFTLVSFGVSMIGNAEESLAIAGSSTLGPSVTKAAKRFKGLRPDLHISVEGGGSSAGVSLVGEGKVQIGLASRAMKATECETYPNIVANRVALDAVVMVINKDVGLTHITSDQVVGIYTGQLKDWSELGVSAGPIHAYSADSSHGTYEVFNKFFEMEGQESGAKLAFKTNEQANFGLALVNSVDGNGPTFANLAVDKTGIGYMSYGVANSLHAKGAPITILSLDGVSADRDSIQSGDYPLQRGLFLLTNADANAEVEAFVEFMKGKMGQAILESNDFLPVQN